MTIRNRIDANELSNRLSDLELCAEYAPEGTYEREKEIVAFIGDTANAILRGVRELGLNAPNCDQIREVEAVLYGYIRSANALAVAAGEGFGAAMSGPARERVIAQAARDRDFLAKVSAWQAAQDA